MLSSVDLPEPDSPTTATHSPPATSRLTSSKSGASAAKRFASPRTASMGPLEDVSEDAEDGPDERAQARAVEQPLPLREDRDRGERDRDLQQRHRDREEVMRVQRLLALFGPVLGLRLVLAGLLLDVLLLRGVAFRFALVKLDLLRIGVDGGGELGEVLLHALRL